MEKITRNKVDRTVYMLPGDFYTWREIFSLRKQPFLLALRRGEERGETAVSQARKFLTILSESVGLRVLNKHLTPKRLRNSHENIGNVRM